MTLNVLTSASAYFEQVTFLEVPGASSTNTITVQSQSGNAADVNLFYAATGDNDNWLVFLYGADYFRLRNMTLTANNNPSPARGRGIMLFAGVENLTIEGNIFNGSPINSPNANFDIIYGLTLVSSNTTATLTPRMIQNNTFNNGSTAIHIDGINTTTLTSGTQILNNTFNNVRRGIELNYHVAPVISGNTITALSDRGMELTYCDGALVVTKNKINVVNTYGFYMYACDGGVPPCGTPGLIANNFITDFGNNSKGIYSYSNTYQNFYYNSVNVLGDTDSRAFEDYASANLNLVNNIFAAPNGGYAYVVNTPTAISHLRLQ